MRARPRPCARKASSTASSAMAMVQSGRRSLRVSTRVSGMARTVTPARVAAEGRSRLPARAVEALHRPAPALVVEHEVLEAPRGVAIDDAPPEGDAALVAGLLAHLPGAAEAVEEP